MLWNFWNTVFDAAFGGSLISNSQRSSDYLMPMPILYKHGSNAYFTSRKTVAAFAYRLM